MRTFEFIFYLGIILIVFRFLWWCFSALLFFLKGGTQKNKFEDYTLKLIAYFLTVSLSARYVTEFSSNESNASFYLYSLLAGFILMMYFVRKFQKRQMMARLSQSFGSVLKRSNDHIDPKFEWGVIGLSMAYFISCLIFPMITENALNNWLRDTINDFYHIPIIGWIIKLLGLFFMFGIIYRGFNAITSLFRGKQPESHFESYSNIHYEKRTSNDEFDDYEEVDDIDEKK